MMNEACSRCRPAATLAFAALLGTTACGDILDVRLPGQVPAERFEDVSLAHTIMESAIGDFECAYANYVFVTAYWTNEIIHAQQNLLNRQWSQRRITEDNSSLLTSCESRWGTFRVLHTARVQAEDAMRRFTEWDFPEREEFLGKAAAYAGYSTLLLGEAYCEVTFDGGPIMTPAEVFQRAEQRFTTAIEHATAANDDATLNMARVGRARARLNLGRADEAAADARLVPVDFVYVADRGAETESRFNKVWLANNHEGGVTVDFSYRGLKFEGVPDPRVQVFDAEKKGLSGETDVWVQLKYPDRDSDIPLATWEEAQLIIAEAEGGQAAVDIINLLHERAGLPAFSSADPDEIRDHLIEERRRALWLTGHRMNDMLRLDLPWRTGLDHEGQPYGDGTCLPLPLTERVGNASVSG